MPNMSASGRERPRQDVLIEAALSLLAQDGPSNLTMRKLAAELGTTTTSIYWHVGGRDSLVDQIVDRTAAEITAVEPEGRPPERRLLSLSAQFRAVLSARVHVLGLAEERKRSSELYMPMKVAYALELERAGVRGQRAASGVDLLRSHVVSFAIFEDAARSHRGDFLPPSDDARRFADAGVSMVTARQLVKPIDFDKLFASGAKTLVASVLPSP